MRDRILEFIGLLRHNGVRVSSAEVLEALRAVEIIGLGSAADLRGALQATLIKRREDDAAFGDLFDLFFYRPGALREGDAPLIAALRQRTDDLPVLIDHFLKMFSTRHDRNVSGISGQAYRMLLAHNWPGNIRELENVIERAVIMCQRGEMLEVGHFPQSQDRKSVV